MSTKVSVAAIILCSTLALTNASAQDSKKEKTPVYSYVIDDPMDAFGRQAIPQTVISPVIFPAFYIYGPQKVKDTLYRYECYDARDELLDVDTLHDFSQVRYISLFKSFTDYSHTYIDAAGKEQPLPEGKIVYRYDKAGGDTWLSVNYANNKYTSLKEYRNDIVKTDTTLMTDPATGTAKNVVHKYYKVIPAR